MIIYLPRMTRRYVLISEEKNWMSRYYIYRADSHTLVWIQLYSSFFSLLVFQCRILVSNIYIILLLYLMILYLPKKIWGYVFTKKENYMNKSD